MKAMFARLGAFLRARFAEPSTHAGVAAFLVAVAGGAAAVGSLDAAEGLLLAAAAAGIKAAVTADPSLEPDMAGVVTLGRMAGPLVAAEAEAVLPEHAARIAALEAQVAALVPAPAPAAAQ